MNDLIINEFEDIIRAIVSDIAKGDYRKLEAEAKNGRVSVADLRRTVEEYGYTIVPLPYNAFELAEAYYVESENRIDIFLPLWSAEEGRSDLTLSLSCHSAEEGLTVQIADLRVL